MKALPVLVIIVIMVALHQDVWNWTNKTLVFGFLPIGLAYHIFYTILASLSMAFLVKAAWPADIEDEGLGAATPSSPSEGDS